MNAKDVDRNQKEALCLVSLSDNYDHQITLFSMFNQLVGEYDVITISRIELKAENPPRSKRNHYVECPSRPGISSETFNLLKANKIIEIIKSSKCKTVYFESVHLWNAYISWRLGKNYTIITTIHDIIPHDGSRSVLYCQKLLCALSDKVVIKNGLFVREVSDLYKVKPEDILVFDVWRHFPPKQPSSGSRKFLFFGRLKKYKGLQNVCEIIDSCPSLEFIVAGSPDAESRELVEQIKKRDNVEVVDRELNSVEMKELFTECDWVLVPYESATQSGVIIDSYKYSRPVIAFDVGAVREQVKDGETGFLIKRGDTREFSSFVVQAADMTPQQLRAFSDKAYEFGYKKYSSQVLGKFFVESFDVKKITPMKEKTE